MGRHPERRRGAAGGGRPPFRPAVEALEDRALPSVSVLRASTDAAGAQADGVSSRPALSADGQYVAFESGASNLVAGRTTGPNQVYVKDLQTGQVTVASRSADGARWGREKNKVGRGGAERWPIHSFPRSC